VKGITMGFLRRSAASLLLFVAVVVGLLAVVFQSVDATAGSPSRAAHSALSVVSNRIVDDAAATALISNISKTQPAIRASYLAHKSTVDAALQSALQTKAIKSQIQQDIEIGYQAEEHKKATAIDLRPLIVAIAAHLHAADPTIPAAPTNFSHATVTISPSKAPTNLLADINPLAWVLVALWIVLAFVGARFLIHKGLFRYLNYATTVAVPVVVGLVAGALVGGFSRHLSITGHNSKAIAHQIAGSLGGTIVERTLILAAIAALGGVILWLSGRLEKRR
jgi:hypothetical protein